MKWFHTKASIKKRRNSIEGIFNENNIWVEGVENVGSVATNFFKNLFQSSWFGWAVMNLVSDCALSKFSNQDNGELGRPYNKEEIEISIKQMALSKAPSSDGVQAMFYQRYWDIIGEDTINMCLGVLNNGEDISPINHTFITLIPKVPKPTRMSEFRVISLWNVDYNIIAKTIANRLTKVLNVIIQILSRPLFLGGS